MYLKFGKEVFFEDIEKVREDFYLGFEIIFIGFVYGIGIYCQKIKDFKCEFKDMFNDKKLYVCMIVLKVERGFGVSILCLQFFYENYERFFCVKLIEFYESFVRNIEKIN